MQLPQVLNGPMSVEEIQNILATIGVPQQPALNPQQMRDQIANLSRPQGLLPPIQQQRPLEAPTERVNRGARLLQQLDPAQFDDNSQDEINLNDDAEHEDNNMGVPDGEIHQQLHRPDFDRALAIGCTRDVIVHHLGPLNARCSKCGALHWIDEKLAQSSLESPQFGNCCLGGKIVLFEYSDPPNELLNPFNGNHVYSKEFLEKIWNYNLTFAMTSLGVDEELTDQIGHGPYVFKIQGQLFHHIGSLLPENASDKCRFAQLWILDSVSSLQEQRLLNPHLKPELLLIINDILHANPYLTLYRTASEILRQHAHDENFRISLVVDPSTDQRRYNMPTANEIAVLVPGRETDPTRSRDIILRYKDGRLQRISDLSPLYHPLYYVLLFPTGERGWSFDIPKQTQRGINIDDNDIEVDPESNSKTVTQREYFAHRLHIRKPAQEILFMAGKLFQEYIVDAWASIDQNRLSWIKNNQPKLRTEYYQGFMDMISNDTLEDGHIDANEIGKQIILPSSFLGSSRSMYQLYQDSMALARYFCKVDYFIKMTANPNWPEIKNALLPHQTPSDRPDIVTRVFNCKKNALLKDLIKDGYLGRVLGHVYTIEFQKRGLPHMHLLLFVDPDSRAIDGTDVDKIISAEFPDPDTDPELHELVLKNMTHGPCDDRCLVGGKCSKHFPKMFRETTSMDQNAYVSYRRRDTGRSYG